MLGSSSLGFGFDLGFGSDLIAVVAAVVAWLGIELD